MELTNEPDLPSPPARYVQHCLRVRAPIRQASIKAVLMGLFISCATILTPSTALSADVPAEATKEWVLKRPLQAFSAQYIVGNDLVDAGQADIVLRQDNNTGIWNYSLNTNPVGIFKLSGKGKIRESTQFQVSDLNNQQTIKPLTYRYRQDQQKKRAIDATFNWDQHTLYYQRGSEKNTYPLSTDTLDRMTMTLAMMSTLEKDFERLTLSVFDGGRLKQVELLNEGVETIQTSLGRLNTVRVRTRNVAGSSRETVTWFAPKLNNIPVRIEQLKRGDLVARLSINQYRVAQ